MNRLYPRIITSEMSLPPIHTTLFTPTATLAPVSGRDPVRLKCLTESPTAPPLLREYPLLLPGFSSTKIQFDSLAAS